MRRPRLLALLILLAALVALGVWTLMPARSGDSASTLASSPELEEHSETPTALEPQAAPQRQEAASPLGRPLTRSTRIHGRVVHGPRALPVAGIEVVCTIQAARIAGSNRSSHQPKPAVEPPQFHSTSGADGSFAFEDLDPNAYYSLDVRGSGWRGGRVDIVPAEEEHTLVVQRAYVARVLATDEKDLPIVRGCEYLRYARVAGPGECESRQLSQSSESSAPEGSPPGQGYEFISDCDSPRLGPFRILICCAGFQRQDFEFWAYPEGMDADVTVFRLQRTSDQAGALRVKQDCGCEGSSCEHLLEGQVLLESVDGSQKPLEFELTGLVREQLFADVPVGSWRLRIRARAGGFCYPAAEAAPLEITVGAEPAVVQVPVARLGLIRLNLRGPAEGLVGRQLELSWQGAGPGETVTLWSSLVMRGVESGTRVFDLSASKFDLSATNLDHVEGARDISSGGQLRIEVDVVAGETKTVVVHLR